MLGHEMLAGNPHCVQPAFSFSFDSEQLRTRARKKKEVNQKREEALKCIACDNIGLRNALAFKVG